MNASIEVLRASNRDLFVACTPATGVAPGTALSTTPPLILWNPPDSYLQGVGGNQNRECTAVIISSRCVFVSGTLGAGNIVYAVVDQATQPTGGTQLTVQQLGLGPAGSGLQPICQAFQGSTLLATPTLLMPAYSINAAPLTGPVMRDYLDGEIVLGPGKALVMQEIGAAGTSPLVQLAFSWLEVTKSFGQRPVQ